MTTSNPAWDAAISSVQNLQAIFARYSAALDSFITQDAACIALKNQVALLARCREQAPVILITGPSGSGKELIAKALHYPVERPFVAVNLAALPDTLYQALLFGHVKGTFTGAYEDRPGAFVAAGNGTIFLDEIGDMPLTQQASLLRVLETFEVTRLGDFAPTTINCRIVAATNKDLDKMAIEGSFREDLLGRLLAFTLNVPPFSQRIADVVLIAQHYELPTDQAVTLYERFGKSIDRFGVRFIKSAAAQWKLFNEIKRIEDATKPPTLASTYSGVNPIALSPQENIEL